ncbi:hypothetical protein [Rodentibacter pneumotropicus]|uniref:hypothetical protein n=1 Tax=Rodentibacter pneumotropicus TaxID=758 RepID=UPI0018644B4C|nr:hypothetical protein [Rodentibacter pneumotropicus]
MKHQLLKKTAINSRTLLLINLNREKEMEGNQDKTAIPSQANEKRGGRSLP